MSRYNDLLSEFGYRETQGFGRTRFAVSSKKYPNNFHDGRDYTYRNIRNNACKVMLEGKITYVGEGGRWGNAYGLLVEMEVAPNTFMVYGHLDRFLPLAKVGDVRKVGDDIGIIGNTGVSTGPHVHLLCRQVGNRVDPKEYIDFRYINDNKPTNNEDMTDKEIRAIVEGIYWSFGMRKPDSDGVNFWTEEYKKEAEKAKWLGRILEGLRGEKVKQGIEFLDARENRWRSKKDVQGK